MIPRDRVYEIDINPKYDGYQIGLVSIVYKFKWSELRKPVIKKIKRRKVYARFKDNIWAEYLAEMRLLSSKNWVFKYLLCAIDVFIKYA